MRYGFAIRNLAEKVNVCLNSNERNNFQNSLSSIKYTVVIERSTMLDPPRPQHVPYEIITYFGYSKCHQILNSFSYNLTFTICLSGNMKYYDELDKVSLECSKVECFGEA